MSTIPSPLASDNLSQFTQLQDILRCFICFGRVTEARMCPLCSKMCCKACITKWLTERKTQCPYCRSHLEVSALVNCRWMEDLYAELERIEAKKRQESAEICKDHQAPLHYFCTTCNDSICADCAMFGTAHTSHAFERLNDVYERHTKQLMGEVKVMQTRLQQLQSLEANAETNIRRVRAAKEERIVELQTAFAEIDARLTAQLKTKLLTLQSYKNEILKESNLLECLLHELSSQLDVGVCPRTALIKKTPELKQMLQDIQSKPFAHFLREQVSSDFTSEVVPNYDSATFEVKNFREIRRQEEVVYSEPLVTNGLTWRLKVYPNGNGIARDMFISVFLELSAGFAGSSKYEYRVEMLNYTDSRKIVSRVFASHFEIGECWGYNRFFRIDMLEEDGYLSPDGTLKLHFHVRSPNFYYLCKDQSRYIEFLERSLSDPQRKVDEVKRSFSDRSISENRTSSPLESSEPKAPQVAISSSTAEVQDIEATTSPSDQQAREIMPSPISSFSATEAKSFPSLDVQPRTSLHLVACLTHPSVTPPNSAAQSQCTSPLPGPPRTVEKAVSASNSNNKQETGIPVIRVAGSSVNETSNAAPSTGNRAANVISPPLSHEAKTVTQSESTFRYPSRTLISDKTSSLRTSNVYERQSRLSQAERSARNPLEKSESKTSTATPTTPRALAKQARSLELKTSVDRTSSQAGSSEHLPQREHNDHHSHMFGFPQRPSERRRRLVALANSHDMLPPSSSAARQLPRAPQGHRRRLQPMGPRQQSMYWYLPSPTMSDGSSGVQEERIVGLSPRMLSSASEATGNSALSDGETEDDLIDFSLRATSSHETTEDDLHAQPQNEPERDVHVRMLSGSQRIIQGSSANDRVPALRTIRSVLVSPANSSRPSSFQVTRLQGTSTATHNSRSSISEHWNEDADHSDTEEDPSDAGVPRVYTELSSHEDDINADAQDRQRSATEPLDAEFVDETLSNQSRHRSGSHSGNNSDSDDGSQDVDFDSAMLSVSSSPHGSAIRTSSDHVPELDVDCDFVEQNARSSSIVSPTRASRGNVSRELQVGSIWHSQKRSSAQRPLPVASVWSSSQSPPGESKSNSADRMQQDTPKDLSTAISGSYASDTSAAMLVRAAHGLPRGCSSPSALQDASDNEGDTIGGDAPRFEEVKESHSALARSRRHSQMPSMNSVRGDSILNLVPDHIREPSPPILESASTSSRSQQADVITNTLPNKGAGASMQFAVLFQDTDIDGEHDVANQHERQRNESRAQASLQSGQSQNIPDDTASSATLPTPPSDGS